MNMSRKGRIAIVILLVLSVLPFIIISIYSRPCVDDYSYSVSLYHLVQDNKANVVSLLKEAVDTDIRFYNNWQGLYTSAFILSLQPGIYGEQFYFIGAITLIAVMYLSLWFFTKTILKSLRIEANAIIVSLFALVVVLQGIPSTVQGIYWYNGAWNYMPFFFLILVNFALLIKYEEAEKNSLRIVCVLLATILSFVISGGNHVTGFLNILLLLVFTIRGIAVKKPSCIFPLVTSIIGFYIVMSAPGTSVRQEALGENPSILGILINSAMQCYIYICEMVDIKWIAVVIIASIFALKYAEKVKIRHLLNPVIIIIVAIILFCGILCVPFAAMSSFGDARVTNIYWLYFVFASVLICGYSIFWLVQNNILNMEKISNLILKENKCLELTIVVLIAVVCFSANSNCMSISHELVNGTAKQFAEENDSRYAKMQNSNSNKTLVFEPLTYSSNLRFDDITSDATDWRNIAWEKYYGHKAVVQEIRIDE